MEKEVKVYLVETCSEMLKKKKKGNKTEGIYTGYIAFH